MMKALQYIAVGIGFCPFWWQWGRKLAPGAGNRMWAIGPFRLSWRGPR